MSYKVKLLTTTRELDEVAGHWDGASDGMPFRSHAWLATWWKYYGADSAPHRSLFTLAVFQVHGREELACDSPERLVAIAPWYLDYSPLKGKVIRWLGDGEVCTDHSTVLCRGDRTAIIIALADALCGEFLDWDQLELDAVDTTDNTLSALLNAMQDRDCLVSTLPADSCWVVDLTNDWATYLSHLSKSHRKQLRQLERRVLNTDRIAWHRVITSDEFDIAWPILVDLHQKRRIALGEPGCFASKRFHDFHKEVALQMLHRNQLRMSWLELDGAPIAAEYHFSDGQAVYAYQGGVDPTRLAEEPGRLSTILCLKEAIAENHRRFDLLRGDEAYKAHWRAEPREAVDCRVIPNRRLARLRGQATLLAESMSNWMKLGTQAMTP